MGKIHFISFPSNAQSNPSIPAPAFTGGNSVTTVGLGDHVVSRLRRTFIPASGRALGRAGSSHRTKDQGLAKVQSFLAKTNQPSRVHETNSHNWLLGNLGFFPT